MEQSTKALKESEKLAIELMTKHKLIDKYWTFKFSNTKRILGQCDTTRKDILLSHSFVMLNWENNRERVRLTILHEIAHAITFHVFGRRVKSHGKEWKLICAQIGGEPTARCSSDKVTTVQGKYHYKCPKCGKDTYKHKRLRVEHACGNCCRKYNNGKFSKQFVLEFVEARELIPSF